MPKPIITPSNLGQYLRFRQNKYYFRLSTKGEEVKSRGDWEEAFNPLSILLSGHGNSFEDDKKEEIEGLCYETLYDEDLDLEGEWAGREDEIRQVIVDAAEKVYETGNRSVLFEPPFFQDIGAWRVKGMADAVLIDKEDGKLSITVLEIKSSWKESTHHQIQATIYAMIIEEILRSEGYELEVNGGVVHKGEEPLSESLETFNVELRKNDVRNLLDEEGELVEIYEKDSIEDIGYELGRHWSNCIFAEVAFRDAVENESVSLLGISESEQRILEEAGITTLQDLAQVKEVPESPKPWEYEPLEPEDEDLASELAEDVQIGRKLDRLVQRAQSMIGELRGDDHPLSANYSWNQTFYQGAGDSKLPQDENLPDWAEEQRRFDSGDMIRVYLHIQWDYMRNRIIMLNGHIDAVNSDTSHDISKIAPRFYEQKRESLFEERQLLENFFEDLFDSINEIADELDVEEAPMHLYMYGRNERDNLMDAVRRHRSISTCGPIMELLGLREGIDQPMVSIIEEEVDDNVALNYPITGIAATVENFYDFESESFFRDKSGWKVDSEEKGRYDLRSIFQHNFFNHSAGYNIREDSIEVDPESTLDRSQYDGYYPIRPHYGSQIPLEYFWSAKDKLSEFSEEDDMHNMIAKYTFHSHIDQEVRIGDEELLELGLRLCKASKHIERCLTSQRTSVGNVSLGKSPLEVKQIDGYSLGESSLDRSCEEFLDLEYHSNRQEKLSFYAQSPRQRVLSGKSAIFRIDELDEDGDDLTIKGTLIYDDERLGFNNPTSISKSCRIKDSSGQSSGSWMVMSPLDSELKQSYDRPTDIEGGISVTVEELNRTSDGLDGNQIVLSSRNFNYWAGSRMDYHVPHKQWTTDEEEANDREYQLVEEGDCFIIDKRTDQLSARRNLKILENIESNNIYTILEELAEGDLVRPELGVEIQEEVNDYIDRVTGIGELKPNREQKEFIKDVENKISVLQGPPGTGKTKRSLANSIMARSYAFAEKDRPFRSLITAKSNKAINEVMEGVCEAKEELPSELVSDDLDIVRITSEIPSEDDQLSEVRYIDKNDEEGMEMIQEHLRPRGNSQSGLGQFGMANNGQIMIFSTTISLFTILKRIDEEDEFMEEGREFFDLVAVDEASMMNLPGLLLAGAFIDSEGQMLISGDHRQMPPIQKHDWEYEDRRTLIETVPHLSALDFFRFLNGELDIEGFLGERPTADVKFYRLRKTYRCHEEVAKILKEWVYKKDDIDYVSENPETGEPRRETIDPVETDREGLNEIIDSQPITVVVHSEDESQQFNQLESDVVSEIIDNLDEEVGVVTPHNAQKGLIKNDIDSRRRVDTVEKYQGGQEDVILLSGAVSDPSYLELEQEFIMDLKRLNVAVSRMKKKLIIVASETIFRKIPNDSELYEESFLWRGIYNECKEGGPDWTGNISDIIDIADNDYDDEELKVYST